MGNSPTVLIVDDEPDVADSFAMLVEQFGYEVRTAHDGRQALELLDDWQADVAFVDLGMPEMNGFELADHLRERGEQTPMLVALTGYGRDEDRNKAFEHGFQKHLVKPPEPDDITDILENAPAS